MNFHRRSGTGALLALIVAVGLAACGGSSSSGAGTGGNGIAAKSPTAILQASRHAADALKSVHVSGSVKESSGQVGLDLSLQAGVGAVGTLTLNGHSVQLVTAGGSVYLNGSPGFWKTFAGSAAATLLAGRWLKSTATGNFAGLSTLGSITGLFNTTFASHGKLAKAGQTTVHGAAAVGVRDTSQGGTLYVATSGQPYPLEIVGSGGHSGDKLSFTDFNAPVKVTVPKGAIDLSQLESTS